MNNSYLSVNLLTILSLQGKQIKPRFVENTFSDASYKDGIYDIHNSNRTSLSNVQIFLILVSLTMIIIRKTKKILEGKMILRYKCNNQILFQILFKLWKRKAKEKIPHKDI